MKKKISKKPEDRLLKETIAKFINAKRSKWDHNASRYDWSYQNVLEHHYNQRRCCNDYGCDEICRCSKIQDIELSDFNPIAMINVVTNGMGNDLLCYCIDRIVRLAKLNEDCFQLHTCPGYYGEEVVGLYLDNHYNEIIKNNLEKLEGKSEIDRIKYVLQLEYGYLLDVIESTLTATVEDIDLHLISCQDEYRKKIDVSENYYDENFKLPRGIFVASGSKYRLIDGYHRVMKAKSLGLKNIKGIMLV